MRFLQESGYKDSQIHIYLMYCLVEITELAYRIIFQAKIQKVQLFAFTTQSTRYMFLGQLDTDEQLKIKKDLYLFIIKLMFNILASDLS